MESALASARSPRKLQQRHILAASASRKRRDSVHGRSVANTANSTDNPFSDVPLQKHHSEASRSLSELVYAWCINDLDYRPENSDTRVGSHVGALTHGSTSIRPLPEFSPESIDSLCDGPLAPMFEYLVENIKPRSAIHASQTIHSNQSERMQVSSTGHAERETIALRNRDLTLTVAQKQREIAETKERIKQLRQLQVTKELHHQQSVQTVKVLQEYDALLRQQLPKTLKNTPWFQENNSDHYALRVTIEKVLREISQTIELVTIKGVTFQQDQVAHGRRVQDLYQTLRQGHDGATWFFGFMKELKEGSLLSLQSQRQEQIQQSENKDTTSKATKLLQLFQNHHGERVDQIDMVLNQISVCEQGMEELYLKMRFQAQRRENEKNPAPFQQGLEETKAHLKGLGTALEFIQAEQENLVERVASMDEQQTRLEIMVKASRAADKKVADIQRVVRKFIEMIKINSQGVPHTAKEISQDITRSISEDPSQLSDLVRDRTYTLEGDSKVMQDLSEQSQQAYAKAHTKVLQAPVLNWRESDLTKEQHANGQSLWREITTKSSISADQHILQLVGLQRHNAVQRLALSNARELSQIMECAKTETTSMMKTFVKALPEESQVHGDGEKSRGVGVSNLTSKFEGDVEDVTRSIVQFEKDHHSAFQSDIQDIGTGLEVGEEIVHKVRSFVDDSDRIAEHLLDSSVSSKPLNSKRMRYIQ